jgi:AcrR family transcriptional regulator
MTQRPDPRPEAARAALAEAMVRLISRAEDGEKPSVSTLCAEAGVSRPTFYRHFKSVDDVLSFAIRTRLDTLSQTILEDPDITPAELPAGVVRLMTEVWQDRPLYRQVLRPNSPYALARQTAQSWVQAAMSAEMGGDQRANTRVAFAAGGVLACMAMLVEDDDLDEEGIRVIGEELVAALARIEPGICS